MCRPVATHSTCAVRETSWQGSRSRGAWSGPGAIRGALWPRRGDRFIPKIIEIVPLHGVLQRVALKAACITGRPICENCLLVPARQLDPIRQQLEVHPVVIALAQAEHQVYGTTHERGENVGAN